MKFLSLITLFTLLVGCGGNIEDIPITCEEVFTTQYMKGCYVVNQDEEYMSLATMYNVCANLENGFTESCPECHAHLQTWYDRLAAYECDQYLGEPGTPGPEEAQLCCKQALPPEKEDPPHYDDDE